MYPAQTSFIPVQVALARFLEQGGDPFANYPYWYLGTTPFRYLTGPILPLLLAGIHKALSQLSLFSIFYLLITIAWLMGGVGVYFLVKELGGGRLSGTLTALFYLFGPVFPFLFPFSNGLYLLAFSFLPFVFLFYFRFLQPQRPQKTRKGRKDGILLGILLVLVMLLDPLIIPTLIFGMAAIFLAQVGWKKAEEKLKRTLLVVSCSFLVATVWYTPGYWLTLLGAPSLAGVGVFRVIGWLGRLLPTALAFGIAIFSVKFFKKRNLLRDFCFYWLFIFGFLTLLRFLSDPDFWLDWISYGIELQFGLGILGGLGIKRLIESRRISAFPRLLCVSVILLFFFGVWLTVFNRHVLGTLQSDITQTVEFRIGKRLSEIAKPGEKALFSGTTVFWVNAFFDIPQVRGGVDQASVDPSWREAVWEIRLGTDPEKSLQHLKDLKIDYLIVHTQDSEEFYHDFVYPEKFEGVEGLEKIYDERGDRIYRVEELR